MSDPVKAIIERSTHAATRYRSLNLQLIRLIDQHQRADLEQLSRKKIEAQKAAIVAEMIELSGGTQSWE